MKKILINLILVVVLSFAILIAILSTIGIETNKFNNLITELGSTLQTNKRSYFGPVHINNSFATYSWGCYINITYIIFFQK